jgi:uncharacterized membrane protein
MGVIRSAVAAVGCVGMLVGSAAGAQPLSYSAIDFKDAQGNQASLTNAQGINSRGDIVGWFVMRSGATAVTHGFLRRHGHFTTIDYPGAVYTDARGIDSDGNIVGAYRMAGEPPVNFHGYLRTEDGMFKPEDFPGHTNTIAQRITSAGVILGCRHDANTTDTMRGIMMNADDMTGAAEIGLFSSMNGGSTPDGDLIVGQFMDMSIDGGKQRGYLLYGDAVIPFDVPGSAATIAWDVNAEGMVVGVYSDGTKVHGFLWNDLRFSSIDYPTATTTATRVFGINDRGDMVGAFVDDAGTHGFVKKARHDDDGSR